MAKQSTKTDNAKVEGANLVYDDGKHRTFSPRQDGTVDDRAMGTPEELAEVAHKFDKESARAVVSHPARTTRYVSVKVTEGNRIWYSVEDGGVAWADAGETVKVKEEEAEVFRQRGQAE